MKLIRDSFVKIELQISKKGVLKYEKEKGAIMMKIRFKKCWTYAIIFSLLLLSACGSESSKGQKVAMGRYIEDAIELPQIKEEIFVNQTTEGVTQLYSYGSSGLKLYERQEDLSWKEIQSPALERFNTTYLGVWINAITTDSKGSIYAAYIETGDAEDDSYDPMGTRTHILKMSGDEVVSIPLVIEDELPYILPSQIVTLDNGNILVYDYKLQVFSLETGCVVKEYESSEGKNILVIDNQIYALNLSENQIDIYNLDNGQIEKSIVCHTTLDESTVLVKGEEKDLYLVTRAGIEHLARDGNIWEQVVDSNGLSLSSPSSYIEAAIYDEERFLVRFVNEQYENSLKEYVYSATTPTQPREEISIYGLEENKIIREAVTAYQLAHPEIRVNVQYGINEVSGVTRQDAIKALNAELLAGRGPDLLVLDDLTIDTYRDKDLLLDLSVLTQKGDFLENIINCFKIEDYTYALPIRFKVPTLWGSKEVLQEVNSLSDLAAYQIAHPNEQVLARTSSKDLFKQFASTNEKQWFNEEGKLQEAELIAFLENIRVLAVSEEEAESLGYEYSKVLEVSNNHAKVYVTDNMGVQGLLIAAAGNAKRGDGDFKILKAEGQTVFEPTSIISINKNSKKQELAKEIVAFMLEESIQKVDIEEGFPVHQGALEKWMSGEVTNKDAALGISSGEDELHITWGNEEVLQAFKEEIKQLEKAVRMDETHINLIIESSEAYFNGEMTAAEAVASMQPKLELYMQE